MYKHTLIARWILLLHFSYIEHKDHIKIFDTFRNIRDHNSVCMQHKIEVMYIISY